MDIGFAHLQVLLLTLIAMLDMPENSEIEMSTLIKTITVLSLIMSIGTLIEIHLPESMVPYITAFSKKLGSQLNLIIDDQRIHGLGLNANITSSFVALGATASIYMLLKRGNTKLWIFSHALNIFLAVYLVFLRCKTRTSMITLILFAMLYIIGIFLLSPSNSIIHKISKSIIIIGIIAFIILTIAIICIPSFKTFFEMNILRIDSLRTGSGRLELWDEYLGRVKDHLLFGVPRHSMSFESSHNELINILTFTGIPGLIMYLIHFCSATFIFFKLAIKEKHKNYMLPLFALVQMVTIFVENQTEWFIFIRYNIVGLLTAYLIGLAIRIHTTDKNIREITCND